MVVRLGANDTRQLPARGLTPFLLIVAGIVQQQSRIVPIWRSNRHDWKVCDSAPFARAVYGRAHRRSIDNLLSTREFGVRSLREGST